ncbi:LTA synthase family protein [uncultured Fibrobacter sp.]|uniref:LTA synthase family protein n=1 Tax=uncultured Fibrobacter sp. TaxID=261512 RepID=UPI00261AFD53|nr:LTA synthase family protein [uncultured Fibrobacter sp.]
MDSYTINFFVASAFAAILAVFLTRHRRFHLVALPVVPVLHFILFYNFDSGLLVGIFPLLVPYAGAIYAAVFFAFFVSFNKEAELRVPERKPSVVRIVLSCVALFLLILYSQVIPWGIDTFPLSNVEAVLFTVFAGANEGSEEFVISSFMANVMQPALHLFVCTAALLVAVSGLLSKRNVKANFRFWKLRLTLAGKGFLQILWPLCKFALVTMVAYCFVISLVLPGIVTSAPFHALFQQPVDSELYREYYANPDSVKVTAPQQPKNLIVIFLESMETNFARYTPEIDSLFREFGFAPGGLNVSGTSWTIAGITGKLCGIPLNMPMGIEEYHGKLPTYLPHASCLMNILANEGYEQVYVQGSSGDFTQKRDFWKVHGNVAIHDIEYFKEAGKIPQDYKVFWGFEDRKLYGFVKEELDSLAERGKPFALYMLTVDTHQPFGYTDELCQEQFSASQEKYPQSLRCASFQLAEFLDWASKQSWFEKTTIAVMGDHTLDMLSAKANVPKHEQLYWTNFILNSALPLPGKSRQYSSLDMFPTLLESMGFVVEGRSMGLGRSLYSNEPTLLEHYGQKTLDSLLRERSIQYDYFLMGK